MFGHDVLSPVPCRLVFVKEANLNVDADTGGHI